MAIETFIPVVKALQPRTAVVLGSGQAETLTDLQQQAVISFSDVPGFPTPTVQGHTGRIVAGLLHQIPILCFQGRLHFYEGHSSTGVEAPVSLAAELGVKTLLLTNAAGGIHPSLTSGSFMLIRDHFQMQGLTHGEH